MDTDAIEAKGLAPLKPYLDEIDGLTDKNDLAALAGKLQRDGIDVFFGYGEQQDFKDASKQIAFVDQAGLGLPERDYYLRTGAKDETIRKQYVEHLAKMLTLAGSSPEQAQKDATPNHRDLLPDLSGTILHRISSVDALTGDQGAEQR
jgi:endothelin-converting enzyme/putative endopeptidase